MGRNDKELSNIPERLYTDGEFTFTNLELNRDYYAVMANALIKGKQSNSLQAARIIRFIISQIKKDDKYSKVYSCTVQELADFLEISHSNVYRDAERIINELIESRVYIGTTNAKHPWTVINYFSAAYYDGNGRMYYRLSEALEPFIVGLQDHYGKIKNGLTVILSSFYSIRYEEVLKSEYGFLMNTDKPVEFTIEQLRSFVGCEKKYPDFKNFRIRVLEPALEDINNNSDITVFPEYVKTGRQVTSVKFEIIPKRKQDYKIFREWKIRNQQDYISVNSFLSKGVWPFGYEVPKLNEENR